MGEPPSKKLRMDSTNDSADMFEAEDESTWAGVLLSSLPRLGPDSSLAPQYPAPRPSPRHTVCVSLPVTETLPSPHPPQLRDIWDGHHVRLPWSKENLYPITEDSGKKVLRSRWELITQALTSSPILNSHDLQEAVLSYNMRYRGHQDWSFSSLHKLFSDEFTDEESDNFFQVTLPEMIDILVQSPKILTCPLPLLSSGTGHSITMSQQQASVLLINAFFCTFPRRNSTKPNAEFSSYPLINFNTLLSDHSRRPEAHMEKLKCLLSYFSRVTNIAPTGLLTFSRRCLRPETFPQWSASDQKLSQLHITSEGMIETEGQGMLQVDFANKFVGGGVLTSGLVQEEIRFTVCPELLASLLFTEVLGDNEVLVIIGAEQFSDYRGYSDSFTFVGRHQDQTGLDSAGRRETTIVAMDAIRVTRYDAQFRQISVDRELNKAFVGFSDCGAISGQLQAVATGNWGCGAFGGDVRLKFLIQMMAASEHARDMAYFTFGDKDLVREVGDLYKTLVDRGVRVGQLYKFITEFGGSAGRHDGEELFKYLREKLGSDDTKETKEAYDADTDDDQEAEVSNGHLNDSVNLLSQDEPNTTGDSSEETPAVENNTVELKGQGESNKLKKGGFFEALDKMERGEITPVHNESVKKSEVKETLTQHKVTDFFTKKQ